MAHTELDLRERRTIEHMLNAKVPVSKIVTEIGRQRSTIYREIKRNFFGKRELAPTFHHVLGDARPVLSQGRECVSQCVLRMRFSDRWGWRSMRPVNDAGRMR
ncbi:MAG: helix-turn-helix domain-containing protein [Roseovarius sp.]|nr:helix-turn-helix domain-containing protein [Roseovarius sp.]